MSRAGAAVTEILDNLRRVFQIINEYSRAAERAIGLTAPQLWALKLLNKTAPLRVSELAQKMYLRPPTIVGIIDRLEGKGLITRTPSREDRRAVEIDLTAEGKELITNAPEVAQDMLMKGLEELSDEQIHSLEEGMKLMAKVLGAEHLTPQPLHRGA